MYVATVAANIRDIVNLRHRPISKLRTSGPGLNLYSPRDLREGLVFEATQLCTHVHISMANEKEYFDLMELTDSEQEGDEEEDVLVEMWDLTSPPEYE